jgi:probable phosphoglycerate mutase
VPPSDRPPSIVLVRHGESTWNSKHLVQGHDDESVLTARGLEQARDVAATLADGGFELIVSSDLTRARQTAAVLAEVLALEVVTSELLRERHYGERERRPTSELTVAVTGIDSDRVVDESARPPGGESLRQLRERATAFLELARERWAGRRLLVVTHGGTIRALRAAHAGAAMQDLAWEPVTNCSVWTLEPPRDEI